MIGTDTVEGLNLRKHSSMKHCWMQSLSYSSVVFYYLTTSDVWLQDTIELSNSASLAEATILLYITINTASAYRPWRQQKEGERNRTQSGFPFCTCLMELNQCRKKRVTETSGGMIQQLSPASFLLTLGLLQKSYFLCPRYWCLGGSYSKENITPEEQMNGLKTGWSKQAARKQNSDVIDDG